MLIIWIVQFLILRYMSSLLVDRFEKVNWGRFLDRNGNTTVGWERPSLSLGSSSQYQKSKKNRCLSVHLIEGKNIHYLQLESLTTRPAYKCRGYYWANSCQNIWEIAAQPLSSHVMANLETSKKQHGIPLSISVSITHGYIPNFAFCRQLRSEMRDIDFIRCANWTIHNNKQSVDVRKAMQVGQVN